MKLGTLAEPVKTASREGAIDAATAEAFASVPAKRQLEFGRNSGRKLTIKLGSIALNADWPSQAGNASPEVLAQIAMSWSCSAGSLACGFGSIRFRW